MGLVGVLVYVCLASPSLAQEVKADYSADDFVKAILSGPLPCPKGQSQETCEANPKTRRFTLVNASAPNAPPKRPGQAAKEARERPLIAKLFAPKPKLSAQDVLVTFASGSAEITPQGQANLRSIAGGLNKPALAELTFEVAGFTDATGSAAFNRTLSQKRAEAVKAFLASLNVNAARLNAVGYGSDHLIDPEDPTSELNRRVELHRLN
jgi:outer membrane protein OmpA-like peptidoglycan-associated protein